MKVHPAGRRNQSGRLLCRWCSAPLKGRQRSWCSERCKREAYLFEWAPIRSYLEHKERGVCTICGIDTEELRAELEGLAKSCERPYARRETRLEFQRRTERRAVLRARIVALETRGWSGCFILDDCYQPFFRFRKSLWEADHITPRVLGGDESRENYRTLCVPCHKGETKRLARYRKNRRRRRMSFLPEDYS